MKWNISFEIYGEFFSPESINFNFTEKTIPGEIGNIGRYIGKPIPYGSASYTVPKNQMKNPFKHLAECFEPILNDLKKAGAEEWHIDIGRIYYAQCNEELSAEDLTYICKLKCGFAYSAYSVDSEDEEIVGFKN